MSMATIVRGAVLWQDNDMESPGEPAILIERYSDLISINQEGRAITISNTDVEAFIKVLRRVIKEGGEDAV